MWIYLTAYYFRNKSSITDVRLGYIQASENIEIFKVKLRWSKPSLLLQRVVFLVIIHLKFVRFFFKIILNKFISSLSIALGQKNNTFVSWNAGNEKYLHPGGRKKDLFINLIEFSKQSLHLKNYSNSTFLCWKTRSTIFIV